VIRNWGPALVRVVRMIAVPWTGPRSMARIDTETDPKIVLPRAQFSNLKDPKTRYRSMRDTVNLLSSEEHSTPTALIIMIACYIDALAGGKGKKGYTKFLARYFTDLSAEIQPEVFYKKFRCGLVHEFSLAKRGCAIADEREIPGKYLHNNLCVEGERKLYLGLNIQRFTAEFLSVLDRLERETSPG